MNGRNDAESFEKTLAEYVSHLPLIECEGKQSEWTVYCMFNYDPSFPKPAQLEIVRKSVRNKNVECVMHIEKAEFFSIAPQFRGKFLAEKLFGAIYFIGKKIPQFNTEAAELLRNLARLNENLFPGFSVKTVDGQNEISLDDIQEIVVKIPRGFLPSFEQVVTTEICLNDMVLNTAVVDGYDCGEEYVNFFVKTGNVDKTLMILKGHNSILQNIPEIVITLSDDDS